MELPLPLAQVHLHYTRNNLKYAKYFCCTLYLTVFPQNQRINFDKHKTFFLINEDGHMNQNNPIKRTFANIKFTDYISI